MIQSMSQLQTAHGVAHVSQAAPTATAAPAPSRKLDVDKLTYRLTIEIAGVDAGTVNRAISRLGWS